MELCLNVLILEITLLRFVSLVLQFIKLAGNHRHCFKDKCYRLSDTEKINTEIKHMYWVGSGKVLALHVAYMLQGKQSGQYGLYYFSL